MNEQKFGWETAVSPIVDILTIIALLMWGNQLANQFQTLSAINATILGGVFILFCFAVYWLKKLEPTSEQTPNWIPSFTLSVTGQRVLGVCVGVGLALGVAHQLGYLESIFIVDDRVLGAGESSAFFVYGPASWLGGGLIYMLILSSTTPPRFLRNDSRFNLFAILGLAGVNLMLVFAMAELSAAIQSNNILWAFAIFPILLIWFLPTRLVYITKKPQLSGSISFAILLFVATLVAI